MTNKDVLVSIVVPVYGTEAYLSACIDSLCQQSYTHLQIILVDDHSPDNCPEICDTYAKKDERIVVVHQKNKGVSGARNTGISHAAGEYYMFVDSDDILYPNAVELMLRDADTYSADIVSATKRLVGNGKTSNACEDGQLTVFRGDEPLLLSLEGNEHTHSACAKLFKTAFVKDILFEEGKNINEDIFFVFQCYMRKPVLVQHNVAVYQYNARPGSASRQAFAEQYLSMLDYCERKKELVMASCPQYREQAYNMEVRTQLQFLDVLCRTTDKKYKAIQKKCVRTVRTLYKFHVPINSHHKKLAWIVAHGLYPLYKRAVRLKYYR